MMNFRLSISLTCVLSAGVASTVLAQSAGDQMLVDYCRTQVTALHAESFAGIKTLDDWKQRREQDRAQLQEMLGLVPLPERSPLHATITGREERDDFTVEKLHYQPLPGLYVTANLYLPKSAGAPAPAILYISGHSRQREGNISFGSKAGYHQHGVWFARHGFVCLVVDSIGELAEIEGFHHGTHSGTRWRWNSRGYTPAGVETWNAMRGLDYLQSRPEVDPARLGVTGRSGGGVGTWWIAALDERVKAAVPVAGMTDLEDQVVVGKVNRHCDCMFMINTYRWDFARIGALIAPRPLLFSNSDKDEIFPLDGVVRMHREIAAIYRLYGEPKKLGLLITDGPHADSQDLQVPAFRWFNRFLKGEQGVIDGAAPKVFKPAELRVFTNLPADQRNTTIDQTFVAAAKPAVPTGAAAWQAQRSTWLQMLAQKTFAGWPVSGEPLELTVTSHHTQGPVTVTQWEFTSQTPVRLPLFVFTGPKPAADVRLVVLDQQSWPGFARTLAAAASGNPSPTGTDDLIARVAKGELSIAYIAPRGIGPTAWTANADAEIHIRRRFMLLGQTLEGMRVWDIRRALEALEQPALFGPVSIDVSATGAQAVNALYASLFARNVGALHLTQVPASHQDGPDYLNVLRILDVPQTLAMAVERMPVELRETRGDWSWTLAAVRQLGWPANRLSIVP